jgi:carbamoyl-phosphate synthase large subunit
VPCPIDDLGRAPFRGPVTAPTPSCAAVGATEGEVRTRRRALGVEPVYRSVDTCAGEFEASTPYHYSTYEEETEVPATGRRRVVVLGSGPNRIGQGVEFDTACVHAVQALREAGYETVMVNCNPETVSTDYDIADRLYVEPLTCEDVLEVCRAEAAGGDLVGVIVTMGGQTPLQLAQGLAAAGVPLLGTPPDAIDLAEDRERFGTVLERCGLDAPPWGQAATVEQAPGRRRPGRLPRSLSAPPTCSAAARGGLLRRRRPQPLQRPGRD